MGRPGHPVRPSWSKRWSRPTWWSAPPPPIVRSWIWPLMRGSRRPARTAWPLILDIAIPRDFDPRIGDIERVMLYNVDDLRAQAEQNRQRRQKGGRPGPGDHRTRDRTLPGRAEAPDPRRHLAPPARRLRRHRPTPRARSPLQPPGQPDPGPEATTSPTLSRGSRTSSSTTPGPPSGPPSPPNPPSTPTPCSTPSRPSSAWPMAEG